MANRKLTRPERWLIIGTAVFLLLVFTIFLWFRAPGPGEITISEGTTYFTEPLDEHGRVDYAADPVPALAPADSAWAEERVADWRAA